MYEDVKRYELGGTRVDGSIGGARYGHEECERSTLVGERRRGGQ